MVLHIESSDILMMSYIPNAFKFLFWDRLYMLPTWDSYLLYSCLSLHQRWEQAQFSFQRTLLISWKIVGISKHRLVLDNNFFIKTIYTDAVVLNSYFLQDSDNYLPYLNLEVAHPFIIMPLAKSEVGPKQLRLLHNITVCSNST